MKHVIDTKTAIVFALKRFTEDGNPVLYQSHYIKGISSEMELPREIFLDRFVSGFDVSPYKDDAEEVEPGYLFGVKYRPWNK